MLCGGGGGEINVVTPCIYIVTKPKLYIYLPIILSIIKHI